MIIPSSKEMLISMFPEWKPFDEEMSHDRLKVWPEYAPTSDYLCDELLRLDKEEESIQSDKDDIQEAQARYIEDRFNKLQSRKELVSTVSGVAAAGITLATGGFFPAVLAGFGVAFGTKYTIEDVIFRNNVYKFNCEARARGYGKARIDRLKDKIRKLDLIMKDPGFLVGKNEEEALRTRVQCKKALELLQKQYEKFNGLWEERIISIGKDRSLLGIPKTIKQGAGSDKYNWFSFYLKDTQIPVIKSTPPKKIEFYQYDSDGVSKFTPKEKVRTSDPLLEREDRLMPYKKERMPYPDDSYFDSNNIFHLLLSTERERAIEKIEEEPETDNLIMRLDTSIRKHRKDDSIELMKRPVDEMRERMESEVLEHKERSVV